MEEANREVIDRFAIDKFGDERIDCENRPRPDAGVPPLVDAGRLIPDAARPIDSAVTPADGSTGSPDIGRPSQRDVGTILVADARSTSPRPRTDGGIAIAQVPTADSSGCDCSMGSEDHSPWPFVIGFFGLWLLGRRPKKGQGT